MRRLRALLATVATCLPAAALLCAAPALAEEASWASEQPLPPGSSFPVGLGRVGDIEFEAPDRGLLITEGVPPTIPAGLWSYNGREWHEYASVCGASQKSRQDGGRIAWAGPTEFWTVSDGRPGQSNESVGTAHEREPPLEDDTLCHFDGGELLGSYAHPAFEVNSYQPMHGAACLGPTDCWFAGEALPSPGIGSFHLHWNGSALEAEPYAGEAFPVEDMVGVGEKLFESVLLRGAVTAEPPALHLSEEGRPFLAEEEPVPLYAGAEPPEALDSLHLSSAEGVLWGAAGALPLAGKSGGTPGQVTVVQRRRGIWSQVIGPGDSGGEVEAKPLPPLFPGEEGREAELLGGQAREATVAAVAAEPGSEDAWLALAPAEGKSAADRRAVLVHVDGEGEVIGEPVVLPSAGEERGGIGPKGSVSRLTCPARDDCWMSTSEGWLFHLAPGGSRKLAPDPGEGSFFKGLISYRPPDQGLPQVTPDAPPADTSGERTEEPILEAFPEQKAQPPLVTLPLLSGVKTRLVHGTTLELRFRLSVRARVALVAKRRRKIVARTPTRTYHAGGHRLMLRLDRNRWPSSLKLETHALQKLRTVSSVGGPGAGIGTESTSERVSGSGLLQARIGAGSW